MTLVVSDISNMGIIMVGDSAVTRSRNGIQEVISGAVKVQYSSEANIGFAVWGNADVGNSRMDYWISNFIQQEIKSSDNVEVVGQKLVDQLNPILSASGKPWKDLVRGIHIGGYRQGFPCLFHVHCGHNNEPAHELRFYKDFPEDQNWSEYYFNYLLNFAFVHLRNGYHPLLGPLFDHVLEYSKQLRANFNISFPQRTIRGRFQFYKLLVRFVAGTLTASEIHQWVNDVLSSIAFNEDGLVIDERMELQEPAPDYDANLNRYFQLMSRMHTTKRSSLSLTASAELGC